MWDEVEIQERYVACMQRRCKRYLASRPAVVPFSRSVYLSVFLSIISNVMSSLKWPSCTVPMQL
jgi:hypothetical protein